MHTTYGHLMVKKTPCLRDAIWSSITDTLAFILKLVKRKLPYQATRGTPRFCCHHYLHYSSRAFTSTATTKCLHSLTIKEQETTFTKWMICPETVQILVWCMYLVWMLSYDLILVVFPNNMTHKGLDGWGRDPENAVK
jgi:hypothetical protein